MYQRTCMNKATILAAQPPPKSSVLQCWKMIRMLAAHNLQSQTIYSLMASLSSLPPEIHLLILPHLPTLARLLLRLTSSHFYLLIPPPLRWELENLEHGILNLGRIKHLRYMTCGGCIRLRPMNKFARNHLFYCTVIPDRKFCLECGKRDLPGPFRYKEGDVWDEGGVDYVTYVRCRGCKKDGRIHAAAGSRMCEGCVWKLDSQKGKGGWRP